MQWSHTHGPNAVVQFLAASESVLPERVQVATAELEWLICPECGRFASPKGMQLFANSVKKSFSI